MSNILLFCNLFVLNIPLHTFVCLHVKPMHNLLICSYIKPMDIVIDFDGTVVTHAFPQIGEDIGAVPVLKELISNGHRLILFTMRSNSERPESYDPIFDPPSGPLLDEAVQWFAREYSENCVSFICEFTIFSFDLLGAIFKEDFAVSQGRRRHGAVYIPLTNCKIDLILHL